MVKIDLLTEKEEKPFEEFLDSCLFSSVQYSVDWRNAIKDLGKDQPFFVIAKENDTIVGVLPLYYYRSTRGNLLTTIAWHTISGILLSNNVTEKETELACYKALLDYSVELAKELDCVALSVATNPFMNDKEYYLKYLKPDYQMENFVQYIDLKTIFDRQGNAIHRNYARRSNLSRNLEKAGLQNTTISDELSKANVDESFRVYSKRMKELGTIPIPKELFDSIQKNLISKGKGRFLFAFNQGKMISSALLIFNDKIMDFYTMCVDSEYKELGSNYLIVYEALKSAHEKGISIANWQSAPNRNDGVYRWKMQWGSRELVFPYMTKILGDICRWRSMDLNELREAYNFHYLLPFNLLKSEDDSKLTTKDEVSRFLS